MSTHGGGRQPKWREQDRSDAQGDRRDAPEGRTQHDERAEANMEALREQTRVIAEAEAAVGVTGRGIARWPEVRWLADRVLSARTDLAAANAAIMRLQKRCDRMAEALVDCEEYFDNRADADAVGNPPRFQGNHEMNLLGVVRRALGKAD